MPFGGKNRPQSQASLADLKMRLDHHREVAHEGKRDPNCAGCKRLEKFIKQKTKKKH